MLPNRRLAELYPALLSPALRLRPRITPVMLLLLVLSGSVPLRAKNVSSHSHSSEPAAVTIAGSLQSELGCSGDWDPSCAATHLTLDATDHVWQGTFTVPAGAWEYKAAMNDGWDESHPTSNVPLNLAGETAVKFYYSHATHWITSSANATIATAAGDFQSELGCPGDWQPDCLMSWLQDPEGDGTYTFSTTAIPAGSYQTKVTIDESWAVNYGDGGVLNGSNIFFTVPADGSQTTFTWNGASHVLDVTSQEIDDIAWNDLRHDSRSTEYRTPGGAVVAGTPVTLRLRAQAGDLTAAEAQVWNDRTDSASVLPMSVVATDGGYDWWQATVTPGSDPTILWYRFVAHDGTATAYYEDDDARDGGAGQTLGATADRRWQLTLYDASFTTPEWAQNGIVYQIFPDRFRNGDSSNDTVAGTFFYGEPGGTIRRSGQTDWNAPICDPRDASGPCPGKYSQNFYGGDLQGIIDELPYLDDLGVTVLYLNPIFQSPSNHKYDTSDYLTVDPAFGDLALFETLTAEAHARGMKVVLDGVFNHTSSDSRYFDRYGNFGSVGACESSSSEYRGWYFFQPASPAGTGVCAGDTFYTSWFGYDSLPKLNGSLQATRDLIWGDGLNSVARYWLAHGADGWRLDVGGDLDAGLTNDPSNDYWEGFRTAVRTQKPDAWIVGEEWGLATPWTLGAEWDATMNYQFSTAVLGFWRDDAFSDNDHASGTSAGLLAPLTPSQLDARLHNLEERYPRPAFLSMMNLLDSHDTSRAMLMLDTGFGTVDPTTYGNPNYDWSGALERLRGAVLLQMTLPGAPTIYYGDEVGLVGPAAKVNGLWEDDPYNRQPYPWADESGTPFYTHLQSGGARDSLLAYYQLLTTTRNAHAALRTGTFDTLLVDDDNDVYAFGRRSLAGAGDAAVVMVNRDAIARTITVDVSGYLAEGTVFEDVMDGNAQYTVTGGLLQVTGVPARGGALLVLASALTAPPAAPADLVAMPGTSGEVQLQWSAVPGATSYDVYKSLMSGGGYSLAGNTTMTSHVVTGLTNSVLYYFVVVSRNDASGLESGFSNEASARPAWDLSMNGAWFNLQWPPSMTHTVSTTDETDPIYGQIYVAGGTDVTSGQTPGIRAQVGYAPTGTPLGPDWRWSEMAFNAESGSNDEYVGTLLPDAPGIYDYAVRYSADGGSAWSYADLMGPQRDGTLDDPGDLTVNASSDTTSPAAPQNLAVVSTSASSIALSWSANAEDDLSGYEIFRAPVGTNAFARVGSVNAPATTWTDASVTGGATYDYHVKAYDTSFNRSAASAAVEATAALRYVDITFTVTVPDFTPGTVFITGNINELGPWNPGLLAATKSGPTEWTYVLHDVLDGTTFDYKFTRGSWESVEKMSDGTSEVTHSATAAFGADGTQDVHVSVENWRDPIVTQHSPAASATSVPTSTPLTLSWSKPMAADSDFSIVWSGGTASGTFTNDGLTTTFTPDPALRQGTEYAVSVSGEKSFSGDTQLVPVSWTFTTACNVVAPVVTAGGSATFCEGGSVTLTSSSTSGNQWYRNGQLVPGETAQTLIVDASGDYTSVTTVEGCSSAHSNAITVSVKPLPGTPVITPGGATTFCQGGSVTLTSSSATGNQWYRNGLPLPGETAQTLIAAESGNYLAIVTSNGCSSAPADAVTVTVNPRPDATIAVAPTLNAGALSTASVNVFCVGVTFSWSISGGTITAGQGTPSITFTSSAAGTVTLMVTVTNEHGCTDTKSADVTVQLAPFGAPPDFRATAAGTGASLQWGAVQSAARYEIYRSGNNADWALRGTSNGTTFAETGLTSNQAYFYRVRAIKADTTASSFSAIDIATTAGLAVPGPCAPAIRASHVLELRAAINVTRAALGMSAATFTDPSLTAGMRIKAAHLMDLRAALAPVLQAIGVTPSYTDATITPGVTIVRSTHGIELMDLIR